MRRLVLSFVILVLIMSPAYAQADDVRFVLGVSPAKDVICGAPGEYATAEFFISSTSNTYENITISPVNTTWLEEGQIVIPPNAQMKTKMNINIPKSTEEGVYDIRLFVCADTVYVDTGISGAKLKTCLYPTINLNVTEECSVKEAETTRNMVAFSLIVAIFLVALLFLRRRI